MTPFQEMCEELGLRLDSTFRVIRGYAQLPTGMVVHLLTDDGTRTPRFETGAMPHSGYNYIGHIELDCIEPVHEAGGNVGVFEAWQQGTDLEYFDRDEMTWKDANNIQYLRKNVKYRVKQMTQFRNWD